MRTIANVVKALNMKARGSGDAPDEAQLRLHSINDQFHKIKPFLFGLNDKYRSRDANIQLYLPFKLCSFDYSHPAPFHSPDMIQKIQQQFGENICREMKSVVLFGFILRENDDLSIEEYIVMGDHYAFMSNRLQDFSDITKPADRAVVLSTIYPNYEKYRGAFSYPCLSMLHDSRLKTGETAKGFSVKRHGTAPEFVKKIVIIRSGPSAQSGRDNADVGKIDWQHQWRVRGHWRKISPQMIGKDREGEYCIVGRTWVKDFVKGDGPLIEKTRIIKGVNNAGFESSNYHGAPGPSARA